MKIIDIRKVMTEAMQWDDWTISYSDDTTSCIAKKDIPFSYFGLKADGSAPATIIVSEDDYWQFEIVLGSIEPKPFVYKLINDLNSILFLFKVAYDNEDQKLKLMLDSFIPTVSDSFMPDFETFKQMYGKDYVYLNTFEDECIELLEELLEMTNKD